MTTLLQVKQQKIWDTQLEIIWSIGQSTLIIKIMEGNMEQHLPQHKVCKVDTKERVLCKWMLID